ncbi:MAG TPA: hypothetical protein VLC29_09665 [Rhizomicrobium sp.]|nr:hypothetical protein [Rhizomicrobium sp.]
MPAKIRPYVSEDLSAMYQVCLATGANGNDASHIFRDWKLLGHIYAGPYAVLSPETAFVVEDDIGVGGYIVGPLDTHSFERQLESDWWPELRTHYADPPEPRSDWTPDDRLAHMIHHPPKTPKRISEPYPAHLHINLLPRLQGGWGKRMMDTWLAAMRERGSPGAHLGVGMRNERAVKFYLRYGFKEFQRWNDVLMLGIAL